MDDALVADLAEIDRILKQMEECTAVESAAANFIALGCRPALGRDASCCKFAPQAFELVKARWFARLGFTGRLLGLRLGHRGSPVWVAAQLPLLPGTARLTGHPAPMLDLR